MCSIIVIGLCLHDCGWWVGLGLTAWDSQKSELENNGNIGWEQWEGLPLIGPDNTSQHALVNNTYRNIFVNQIFLSAQKFSHEDNCWEQFVLILFCTIVFGSKIRHDWYFFSLIIWLLTHWDFHKDGGLDCPLFSYTSIHHNWGQNIKITLFLTIYTSTSIFLLSSSILAIPKILDSLWVFKQRSHGEGNMEHKKVEKRRNDEAFIQTSKSTEEDLVFSCKDCIH